MQTSAVLPNDDVSKKVCTRHGVFNGTVVLLNPRYNLLKNKNEINEIIALIHENIFQFDELINLKLFICENNIPIQIVIRANILMDILLNDCKYINKNVLI